MKLILGPMLRHVTATTATVWVETDQSCVVSVLGFTAPTFSVHGHHFALVIINDLQPGSIVEYQVHLDGERHWPMADLPPSSIRTPGPDGPDSANRIVFGSCRSSAPHEPPYSLELDHDDRGRGVDALWALGRRMRHQPPDAWPTLLVFLGDQVYADDSSPRARERIEARRNSELPAEIVADFEEYTWLYHEAWSQPIERWMMSVVPSVMIFDDHDMIDDWNISAAWVESIRRESWWRDHITGGLTSYWIYQHLGNLSPSQIEREGMLAQLQQSDDATAFLDRWAMESESFTPLPGGYEFSFIRELGDVRLVMIDVRNGRILDPGNRRMVDQGEWKWIRDACLSPCRHLVLGSSLPVFVPGGLHGIQRWNEAMCDRPKGSVVARLSERVRRAVDLEDWPAFALSFDSMLDLLAEVSSDSPERCAPDSITIVSGDIHFAYVADVQLEPSPTSACGAVLRSELRQVVSSPIRNALVARERRVIRFGTSRLGRRIGQRLLVRHPGHSAYNGVWEMTEGPYFANNIGVFTSTSGEAGTAQIMLLGADSDDAQRDPTVLTSVPIGTPSTKR